MRSERALIRRFPMRWREIVALCEKDDGFRSLCADYDDTKKALNHWLTVGGASGRAEEYREIAFQIEAEIIEQLHQFDLGAIEPPSQESKKSQRG